MPNVACVVLQLCLSGEKVSSALKVYFIVEEVRSVSLQSQKALLFIMVLFALEVKCIMENVDSLYTGRENFAYTMKVKCTSCGEESANWHFVDGSVEYECKSGHGKVNFHYKCKLCSRENTINLVKDSLKEVSAENCERFCPIASFDCRGLEPIAFTPGSGWQVKAAESGQLFSQVNMEENEWVDYDLSTKQSVGIYDFESRFVRIK